MAHGPLHCQISGQSLKGPMPLLDNSQRKNVQRHVQRPDWRHKQLGNRPGNKVPVPMRFGVALPPPPPAEDSSCSMANRAAVFLLTLMWNHTVNHKVTNTVRALAWLGLRLFAWLLSTLARTWSLLVTLGSILSNASRVESSFHILSTCGPCAERQCQSN